MASMEVKNDYKKVFETDQMWPSRHDLVNWVKERAAEGGHKVVIAASSTSTSTSVGRVPAVYIVCARSGKYRQHGDEKKTNRPIRTRKCECPFSLRANMVGNGVWKLSVKSGEHNHEGSKYVASKEDDGKLHGMAKEILMKLSDPNAKVKDFANDLLGLPGFSETPTKNIYNARSRLKSGHNDPIVTKLKELAAPEIGGSEHDNAVDATGDVDLYEMPTLDQTVDKHGDMVEYAHSEFGAVDVGGQPGDEDMQAMEVLLSMKEVKDGNEMVENVELVERMDGMGSGRGRGKGVVRLRGPGRGGKKSVDGAHELGVYDEDSRSTIPYWMSIPVSLRPIIQNVEDVMADGNCGYRAVARQLGMGEANWKLIRKDCRREMTTHPDLYKSVMSCEYDAMLKAVAYMREGPHRKWWFQLPEMGHVVASTYDCVLHTFGAEQCLTFFPLRTAPLPLANRKVITLCHVNNSHFVIVHLKPDGPVPPTSVGWTKYHYPAADGWPCDYVNRMEQFKNVLGRQINTDDGILFGRPIHID